MLIDRPLRPGQLSSPAGAVPLADCFLRSWLPAVTLAAVLAGIFVFGARAAAQPEQVVLGLLAPLTGNYATGGWSIANAMELAVNEANASGRYRVRFVAVEELGVSSLAIMYSNSDYGVGLRRAVEEAAANAGARVVAAESYGDTNFSAQLTSIAGRKPDALYIAGYYTEAAMIFCPGAIRARRAAAAPPA